MRRLLAFKFLVPVAAVAILASLSACGRGFLITSNPPKVTAVTTADTVGSNQAEVPPEPISANTFSSQDAPVYTGLTKSVAVEDSATKVEVPYVTAGQASELDDVKKYLGSDADANLGQSVTAVNIKLLDSQNQVVKINPAFADVSITLKDQAVKFHAPIITNADHLVAIDSTAVGGTYKLSLVCGDATCLRALLVLTRTEHSKIGVLYYASTPTVTFEPSLNTASYKTQVFQTLAKQTYQAQRISVTVYPGPSFSQISVPQMAKTNSATVVTTTPVKPAASVAINPKSTVNPTSAQPTPAIVPPPAQYEEPTPELFVQTDLLATEVASSPVNEVRAKNENGLSGELFGDNARTNSLIIDLKKQNENLRMFVNEESSTDEGSLTSSLANSNEPGVEPTKAVPAETTPAPKSITPGQPSTTRLPPKTGAPATTQAQQPLSEIVVEGHRPQDVSTTATLFPKPMTPNAVRVSAGFAQYESNPYVKQIVKAWLGQGGEMPDCYPISNAPLLLSKFLTYAPNVSDYVGQVTSTIDVTSEIAYLLPLESNYAVNENYPTLEKNPTTTASGPMMIENDAATDAKKFAQRTGYRFVTYKTYNKDDDRFYFLNAVLMSSHYFWPQFQKFSDPALAIVAYNGGPGFTDLLVKKLNLDQHPLSLDQVLQYHVKIVTAFGNKPIDACRSVSYALQFLALRTIGQNLDKYHIKLAPANSDKYKERLQNPNNPVIKI